MYRGCLCWPRKAGWVHDLLPCWVERWLLLRVARLGFARYRQRERERANHLLGLSATTLKVCMCRSIGAQGADLGSSAL